MRSLIRKSVQCLAPYVPGEQPGRGVIKLNANENPYPPSPAVWSAVKKLRKTDLSLYPDPFSLRLRKKIAQIHGCDCEQVFVGNGSDEILALCT
ncbi:MAG: aminotransferase class I/II-fold pyridoxal phosphate-dependent enzyme, partial [Kiritimatiellia bacterium]